MKTQEQQRSQNLEPFYALGVLHDHGFRGYQKQEQLCCQPLSEESCRIARKMQGVFENADSISEPL
jgi:hypothetical protein